MTTGPLEHERELTVGPDLLTLRTRELDDHLVVAAGATSPVRDWAGARAALTALAADLLEARGLHDPVGFGACQLGAALSLAGQLVDDWTGDEWPLEGGEDGIPAVWPGPDEPRRQHRVLVARGGWGTLAWGTFPGEDLWGLTAEPLDPSAAVAGTRALRPGDGLPHGLLTGVQALVGPEGSVAECLLVAGSRHTMLLAAEADAADDWLLHEESVVTCDADRLDGLSWRTPRLCWTPLD